LSQKCHFIALLFGVVVRIVETSMRSHIMPIKLRVVGILYNNVVTLPGGSGTVKQVLDAARVQPGSGQCFGYVASATNPCQPGAISVTAIAARYTKPIKSVTSGKIYPAGLYYLAETYAGSSSLSIWQYYIFDKQGRVVGANDKYPSDPTNPGGGKINFFNAATAIVPDGGSLVWRLVAIPTQPRSVPDVILNRMGLDQPAD
jgi:hypothetical protein